MWFTLSNEVHTARQSFPRRGHGCEDAAAGQRGGGVVLWRLWLAAPGPPPIKPPPATEIGRPGVHCCRFTCAGRSPRPARLQGGLTGAAARTLLRGSSAVWRRAAPCRPRHCPRSPPQVGLLGSHHCGFASAGSSQRPAVQGCCLDAGTGRQRSTAALSRSPVSSSQPLQAGCFIGRL